MTTSSLAGCTGAGHELMRKSVGLMSWLKASTDAALALPPASAQVSINFHACSADTNVSSLSAASWLVLLMLVSLRLLSLHLPVTTIRWMHCHLTHTCVSLDIVG